MTKEEFEQLPLSAQLLAACEDYRALENDPNVRFNMACWVRNYSGEGPCQVCLAGTILYKRFNQKVTTWVAPRWAYDIDGCRIGELPVSPVYSPHRSAFRELVGMPEDDGGVDLYDPEHQNYTDFKTCFLAPIENYEEAARYLQEHGL